MRRYRVMNRRLDAQFGKMMSKPAPIICLHNEEMPNVFVLCSNSWQLHFLVANMLPIEF